MKEAKRRALETAGWRVGSVKEFLSHTEGNLKPGSSPRAVSTTILAAKTASLKRLAWAYGCAKKGSDEERQLRALLVAKVKEES